MLKNLSLEEKVIFTRVILSPIKIVLDRKVDILVSNPPYIPVRYSIPPKGFNFMNLAWPLMGYRRTDFYKEEIDEVGIFYPIRLGLYLKIGHDQGIGYLEC